MNLRAAPAVFSYDLDNRNGVLSTILSFSFLDLSFHLCSLFFFRLFLAVTWSFRVKRKDQAF